MDSKKTARLAAIVLGINDALIELTGALVGLTFALAERRLVVLTGLITGMAATLSMAASAYMHARQEMTNNAAATGFYTGISYFVVVILLVAPFIFFDKITVGIKVMLLVAFLIIAVTSWYSARNRRSSVIKEFLIMFFFSLGVAIISFMIGQILTFFLP